MLLTLRFVGHVLRAVKVVKWIDSNQRGPLAANTGWHYTTEYTDEGQFMRCTRNPIVKGVINLNEKRVYPSVRHVPISLLLTMPGFDSAVPYSIEVPTDSSSPE